MKYKFEKEIIRGCGKRELGGMYLVGEGFAVPCDRLPYNIELCPTCGGGLHQQRNFQWIDWYKYAGKHGAVCKCKAPGCPICQPIEGVRKYGLLWVGERSYTPESFIEEAMKHGVSKRIPWVPKELVLGETWILLAHPDAGYQTKFFTTKSRKKNQEIDEADKKEKHPAIFYAFRPLRVEKLVKETTSEKELEKLVKQKITPILVKADKVEEHIRVKKKRK